ncbi:toxin-antitoxin system YwqK family antitoxin [Saccharopolyspora rhizosphaerae]|nr:hypothetical protein [Saccharopolyspora rhizosphaerae]
MITTYQGSPFTGEVVDFAADGTVIELTSYENGIEHGPQVEWFPNGTKQLEGRCDRGKAVGEWREWHSNGRLARYEEFDEFGELLKRQRWSEAGELTEDHTGTPPRR